MYSCQSKPAEGRDVNEGGPDGVQLPLWALHNPPSHWLTDWQLHIPPHPQLSPLISLPRLCLILGHRIRHWREFLSFLFPFRTVQKYMIWHLQSPVREQHVYYESKFLPTTNFLQFVTRSSKLNKVSYRLCQFLCLCWIWFSLSHYKWMGISTAEWAEILLASYSASTFGKYSD